MFHGIGHVLARKSAHGQRVLMSSTWMDLHGGMFFAGYQSKAMQASLSDVVCPAAASAKALPQKAGAS